MVDTLFFLFFYRLKRNYVFNCRSVKMRDGSSNCCYFATVWWSQITFHNPPFQWDTDYSMLDKDASLCLSRGQWSVSNWMTAVDMTQIMILQLNDLLLTSSYSERFVGYFGESMTITLRSVFSTLKIRSKGFSYSGFCIKWYITPAIVLWNGFLIICEHFLHLSCNIEIKYSLHIKKML